MLNKWNTLRVALNLQVLVPCCGSLTLSSYSDSHFDSYVLQPVEDGYKTADGKVCLQHKPVCAARCCQRLSLNAPLSCFYSPKNTKRGCLTAFFLCVCYRRSGSRTGRSCWDPGSRLQCRSPSCSRRPSTTTGSKATASCASPGPWRWTRACPRSARRLLTA